MAFKLIETGSYVLNASGVYYGFTLEKGVPTMFVCANEMDYITGDVQTKQTLTKRQYENKLYDLLTDGAVVI